MQKKILLIFFNLLIINQLVFSQLRLGLSAGMAIPTGDFGTINKNGYGLGLSSKYQISERFTLTANFSYYAFGRSGGDLGGFAEAIGLSPGTAQLINLINLTSPNKIEIPKVSFFPVTVGFEYYLLKDKIKPYVGFDIGMYVRKTTNINLQITELVVQYYTALGQPVPTSLQPLLATLSTSMLPLNGNDANFGIAPAVGCNYQLNEKWNLDLNIKAHSIFVPEKKSAALVMIFNLGFFYAID